MIILKEKNHIFWALQISGWLLFLLLILVAYWARGDLTVEVIQRYVTGMSAGFLVTLALRHVYRKVKTLDLTILRLFLSIFLSCLIGANALIWIWKSLRLPLSGWQALTTIPKLTSYLYWIMWWFVPLVGWSALYFGIGFWQAWLVRKERTEKDQALAQAAQLQMLRYRMNPHFLFNAMNSIRALIAEDKDAAKRMVTELSEFLRYSLVSKKYRNVPFRDELDSVQHFFNIQKVRYENKLDVAYHVDSVVDDFPIVSFLLHPLAENAVRYGMRTSPLPLSIRVDAGPCPEGLQVEICNSGSWIEPSDQEADPGLTRGLDYVRQRLADAYPDNHRFETFEKDGMVFARLVIGRNA